MEKDVLIEMLDYELKTLSTEIENDKVQNSEYIDHKHTFRILVEVITYLKNIDKGKLNKTDTTKEWNNYINFGYKYYYMINS